MELLHLIERNSGQISQNRGTSPEVLHSSHQETEPNFRRQLVRKVKLFCLKNIFKNALRFLE